MIPTKREMGDVRNWRDALRRAEQITLGVRPVYVRAGILEMGPAMRGDICGQSFVKALTEARWEAEQLFKTLEEIGEDQADRVTAMMTDSGFQNVEVAQDLNKRDRMVRGCLVQEV